MDTPRTFERMRARAQSLRKTFSDGSDSDEKSVQLNPQNADIPDNVNQDIEINGSAKAFADEHISMSQAFVLSILYAGPISATKTKTSLGRRQLGSAYTEEDVKDVKRSRTAQAFAKGKACGGLSKSAINRKTRKVSTAITMNFGNQPHPEYTKKGRLITSNTPRRRVQGHRTGLITETGLTPLSKTNLETLLTKESGVSATHPIGFYSWEKGEVRQLAKYYVRMLDNGTRQNIRMRRAMEMMTTKEDLPSGKIFGSIDESFVSN